MSHIRELVQDNIYLLKENNELLKQLEPSMYSDESILTSGTLGKHTRHIINYYESILNPQQMKYSTIINYENRERGGIIEIDLGVGITRSMKVICELDHITTNKEVTVQEQQLFIQSTLERELLAAREHTIHHNAIITSGFLACNIELPKNYGVAPSTVRYQNGSEN